VTLLGKLEHNAEAEVLLEHNAEAEVLLVWRINMQDSKLTINDKLHLVTFTSIYATVV
jgi:hypothetical protein